MKTNNYEELIKIAPFGYAYHKILLDSKGNPIDYQFLEINKSFENIVSLSTNDILNRRVKEVLPGIENDSHDWINFYGKIALTGGSVEFEQYSETLKKWFKVLAFSQKKNYFSTIFIDITKEKEILVALKSSEKKYKMLLENSREGIVVIHENRFLFANPEIEKITGYSKKELLSLDINTLFHSDDSILDLSTHAYDNESVEDYVVPYQFKIINKFGKTKWIELSTSRLTWDNESAVLCFLTDVTVRKDFEYALIKSERKKSDLIKSMDDLIFILDKNFVFKEFYAPNIKQLFLNPQEFLNKEFNTIDFPNPAFSIIKNALESTKLTGKTSEAEYYIKYSYGTLWYNVHISVVNSNNSDDIEFLCVARDITQIKESENELREERDLFSSGPVITIVWGLDFGWPIKRISKNVKSILGYELSELLNDDFFYASIIHPEDLEKTRFESENNIERGIDSFEQSYRLKNKIGEYHWFYDFTKIIRDSEGNILEIRGYLFDQTDIKEIESELEKERKRLVNVIKGTHIGTWEWNVQTGDTTFNEIWAEMIGYNLEELSPTTIDTWKKYVHPDDLPKAEELMDKHFSGKTDFYECEFRMKHKNGDWIWILDRGKVLTWTTDNNPLLMFGTHMDINEKKLSEQKILELSIRDPLTNLYNRRYIFDRLREIKEKYKRTKENFSVCIIDLDFFKLVNDIYGHMAGDYVLQEFSKILGKKIRLFDLLGRYGGEEFILVMINCSKELAFKRIHNILANIRNTVFYYNEKAISITFSCGISDSEDFDSQNTIDRLIDTADKRLYKAKSLGRNRVIIENEL